MHFDTVLNVVIYYFNADIDEFRYTCHILCTFLPPGTVMILYWAIYYHPFSNFHRKTSTVEMGKRLTRVISYRVQCCHLFSISSNICNTQTENDICGHYKELSVILLMKIGMALIPFYVMVDTML